MNGAFIIHIKSATGRSVTSLIRSEIPVTPPSIKSLGIKKPFSPRPANKIPEEINIKSLICLVKAKDVNFFLQPTISYFNFFLITLKVKSNVKIGNLGL